MPTQQITDGSPDGAQFPNTKLGFYGVAPVAQRATTSNQQSSKLSSATGTISVSTAAFNQVVLALTEVMLTLNAYGLWGTI